MRRVNLSKGLAVGVLSVSAALLADSSADAAVVTVSGPPAPDGNGTLRAFVPPVLNEQGQLLFVGQLVDTAGGSNDNSAVYRADGTTLTTLAHEGDAAPGGLGTLTAFPTSRMVTETGAAVFYAQIVSSGGSTIQAALRSDAGTQTVLLRTGQVAPSFTGNTTIASFSDVQLNGAGQAVVAVNTLHPTNGLRADQAIYRAAADGSGLTTIARAGQQAPGGTATYDRVLVPAFNDAGQVAFQGILTGIPAGGIFRGDGTTSVQIARAGQTAPNSARTFSTFEPPAINDAGQVAFRASLSGGSPNQVMLRGDGTTLTPIAFEGGPGPGGAGVLSGFGTYAINNAGQVLFNASLGGLSADRNGAHLLRGDGTSLTTVAGRGQAVPGGGTLSSFVDVAFNDAGQAAFTASLNGTPGGTGDNFGLYAYDDAFGLLAIAREGDALLGSTISNLFFAETTTTSSAIGLGQFGDERDGLNDAGTVAYLFTLADGREGIATFNIPEPGTTSMLALSALAAGIVRHRRHARA